MAIGAAAASAEFALEPFPESIGARVANQMHDAVTKANVFRVVESGAGQGLGPEGPFGARYWLDAWKGQS